MTQQRLALVMIVHNEGDCLAHCLESIKSIVDEMIIVDTGSSDDTVQIARQYTPKVYSYQWHNDFSAARNFALDKTTCEWVLSLDADELLEGVANLHSLISDTPYSAFFLPLCALKCKENDLEYDRFMVLRLFRSIHRFQGTIHEFVKIDDSTAIGYAQQPVIWHTPVSTTERHHRRRRNIRLLTTALKENSSNPCLHYYLGTEWLGLGRISTAIRYFKQALSQLPIEQTVFRTPAIRHLISCYKNTDCLNEGLYLCLEESLHYPEYCDLFFDGGVLFELKGEYEIALKWFEEAVKLGPPPLALFHTAGTDSYLAYYHLGFCAEKLGLHKEAHSYYEQALTANKSYYYPLYQLVLLKLTQQTAAEVLTFLQASDYLASSEVATNMAELFWTAGFPDIALSCFKNSSCHQPAAIELLARYQFYSGKTACALQSLANLRQTNHEPSADIIIDEIAALLLLKRFTEARQRLWSLWRRQNSRDAFWAAFILYKKLVHDKPVPLPGPRAAAVLLDLADRCMRSRSQNLEEQKSFALLVTTIKELLKADAECLALLINHLNSQENTIKQRLDYTFTALRGLIG